MSHGPPRTIQLHGALDIHTARELAPTLSEAVGDTSREVVVDVRRATFMDSTLLGALAHAARQMRNQGRRMTLQITSGGAIERLLEISGLETAFEVVSAPPGTVPGSSHDPAAAA
jgi:anti-anti-sigma factor